MSKRKPTPAEKVEVEMSYDQIRRIIFRIKSDKLVEKFAPDFVCNFSSAVKVFKDAKGNHVLSWPRPAFLRSVFPDDMATSGNVSDQTGFEGCTLVEQVSALLTVTVHPNRDLNVVMDLPSN